MHIKSSMNRICGRKVHSIRSTINRILTKTSHRERIVSQKHFHFLHESAHNWCEFCIFYDISQSELIFYRLKVYCSRSDGGGFVVGCSGPRIPLRRFATSGLPLSQKHWSWLQVALRGRRYFWTENRWKSRGRWLVGLRNVGFLALRQNDNDAVLCRFRTIKAPFYYLYGFWKSFCLFLY